MWAGVITCIVAPLCLRESIYGIVLHWLLNRLSEEVRHVSSRPLFIVWRQSIVSYPGGEASRPSRDTYCSLLARNVLTLTVQDAA